MKSAIYMDNNRFIESEFKLEENFENIVKNNSKTLFGTKTIYFDIKKKIETKTMGGSIPDGFLFDFREIDNPKFYLVEVELFNHDFDRHIFPQIKKFFSFYKNPKSRDEFIGTIFNYIKVNPTLEKEFKKYIGEKEIYKTLKDIIENSQNILLIIDEYKPEFDETSETITEWAKLVKVEVLKQYVSNNKSIYSLSPDFEDIEFTEPTKKNNTNEFYTEQYHLDGIEPTTITTYQTIKSTILEIDSEIKLNPQRYYISLRHNKNFAYIYLKKKKIWITLMVNFKKASELIKNHKIVEESEGVKRFYGGECTSLLIENENNLDEVKNIIKEAYTNQKK